MKIGIFGGTFDPPHKGHLALAQAALEELGLDEVLFVPAARNPLKGRGSTSAKDRLEMTRIAVEGNPKFAVSDIEIARGGASYMIDTLHELQVALPADYWLLMGADSLATLPQWKSPERVLKLCRFAVAARATVDRRILEAKLEPEARAKIDWLKMPETDISSTEIRDTVRRGRSASLWVTPEVLKYIEKQKLYRG
ncbi:MAG: nicotinate-nucleotide adenylyltransferase [Fimbriimonadales bacterium]